MQQRSSLGRLIRNQREARDWSVRQLAQRISTPESTVRRIETGAIANPKLGLVRAIAEVLDLPPVDLFTAAGYTVPDELPSFRPYLRTKYGELPYAAIAELEDAFADITRRYQPDGPQPGEDEFDITS